MIALVGCIRDCRCTDAVADYRYIGSSIDEFIYNLTVCTLSQCTDDGSSAHEYLFTVLIQALYAFCRNFRAAESGQDLHALLQLRHEQRAMSYVRIRCQHITHLHNLYLLAFLCEVQGTFTAGQPAAQYNNLVADFVLLLVVVVHNHYIRSGQSRDRHDQSLPQ